jgi:hypothetical protein
MTPVCEITPSAVLPFQAARGLFDRITGEYLEMPGLNLTLAQAMRLFAIDRPTCTRVLNELVNAGFLVRDETDRYVRAACH